MSRHLQRARTRLDPAGRRRVSALVTGVRASTRVDRSLDLHDLREYRPGDDLADVDQRASARSGEWLVRRWQASRHQHLLLVLSSGRQMAAMHTPETTKREVAIEAAAVLALAASAAGDRVGVVYGDARGGRGGGFASRPVAIERALEAAYAATTTAAADSDLATVLGYVSRTVRRRTLLVVIADEDHPGAGESGADGERRFRALRAQHELLFLGVADLDPTTARAGYAVESGDPLPSYVPGDPALAREYADRRERDRRAFVAMLRRVGVTHQRLEDTSTVVADLHRLLRRHRGQRMRQGQGRG